MAKTSGFWLARAVECGCIERPRLSGHRELSAYRVNDADVRMEHAGNGLREEWYWSAEKRKSQTAACGAPPRWPSARRFLHSAVLSTI